MSQTPVATPLRTYRILALALMGAIVVIGIAISFILASPSRRNSATVLRHGTVPLWQYLAIAALGLVMAIAISAFGYRVPAIPPGADPSTVQGQVGLAYQRTMFLRFALAESVAIIAIAATFADNTSSITLYLLAAAISLALMAYHVWPSAQLIERVQQQLDRNGGRSDLAGWLRGDRPLG